MYCRHCGAQIPDNSAFCPRCGTAQGEHAVTRSELAVQKQGIDSIWVILALIFFFPVGLVLMWTSSRWSSPTKWAISGLFFWPLWSVLIWNLPWPRPVRLALIAALIGGSEIFFALKGGAGAFWGTLVVTLLFLVLWVSQAARAEAPPPEETQAGLRRIIESKLDTCHDLIAQVEDSVQLRMVPTDSPAARQYQHALEMRAEGVALYERATSRQDLVAADERISRALDRLRVARDGILGDP